MKKACDEECARGDAEREEKEKETSRRISLETEIAALKFEISSLLKEEGFQSHVLVAEKNRLGRLLVEERAKADVLQKNAEAKKQEVSQVKN